MDLHPVLKLFLLITYIAISMILLNGVFKALFKREIVEDMYIILKKK